MWSSSEALDADQSGFTYVSPWIRSPPTFPNLAHDRPSVVNGNLYFQTQYEALKIDEVDDSG